MKRVQKMPYLDMHKTNTRYEAQSETFVKQLKI
jgi:hypothetical protein